MSMRKKLLALLVPFATSLGFSQLNGDYTIGNSGADYSTIQSAVTELTTLGVSGPVTFNINDGIYDEQVNIDSIAGSSRTNTVTFTSTSGNKDLVEITYAPSIDSNYILNFAGADHVYINNLTFTVNPQTSRGVIISINGASNDLHFDNIKLNGLKMTSNNKEFALIYRNELDTGVENDSIFITNSWFNDGSYGIYYKNHYKVDSKWVTLLNNKFYNNFSVAIHLQQMSINGASGTNIQNNYIYNDHSVGDFKGIYLTYVTNDVTVANNYIQTNKNSGKVYGIHQSNCSGQVDRHNWYNNVIEINGGASQYGLYLQNGNNNNFYHNTVILNKTTGASYAVTVSHSGRYRLVNNNFVNLNSDANAYLFQAGNLTSAKSAWDSSGFNNMYTNGTNFAKWGIDMLTMDQFRDTMNSDYTSVSTISGFNSDGNWGFDLCSSEGISGYPLTNYPTDINGETRSQTAPIIGAIETVDSSPVISLSGLENSVCPGGISNTLTFNTPENGAFWIKNDKDETITISEASTIETIDTNMTLFWESGNCNANYPFTISYFENASIVKQPLSISVEMSDDTSLTISATGDNLTYQWLVDDGSGFVILDDEQNNILLLNDIELNMDGYKYKCIISGCNEIESEISTLTVIDPVGLQSTEENSNLTLYPNPSNGTLYLGSDIQELNVFDVTGNNLNIPMNQNTHSIQLERGMYFIISKDAQGTTQTNKVIIQ